MVDALDYATTGVIPTDPSEPVTCPVCIDGQAVTYSGESMTCPACDGRAAVILSPREQALMAAAYVHGRATEAMG